MLNIYNLHLFTDIKVNVYNDFSAILTKENSYSHFVSAFLSDVALLNRDLNFSISTVTDLSE